MSIPDEVRAAIRDKLWDEASRVDWCSLGQGDKARFYELWTRDSQIGERLTCYMDRGQVRVYIKDTLLKGYGPARLADPSRPMRAVGLLGNEPVLERYTKPHGLRLADGRVLCWGRALDWKVVLTAVHERTYLGHGKPFAAVLTQPSGRYCDIFTRGMVGDAARRLGIAVLAWLD
jgi:hypothetical protein